MKHFFLSLLLGLILFSTRLLAETQTFSYQGVAISSLGQVLTNQTLSVRLSIFDDIASGSAAYIETNTVATSATGVFTVQVGSGIAITGTYASVNLMAGVHYLQIEIKPAAGSYAIISKGPIAQSVIVGWQCGGSLTVSHIAGGVAPISKTVTYSTVTNIPGETTKCWITSNLGADHQATAVNDATEASAGWLWQFNRKQGYRHDGTTRTPNTAWIGSISETSDWLTTNDPCTIELGSAWRLPTNTEWTNVDASGNWTTWTGTWNSALKLHAAGYLNLSNGSLSDRGLYGYYWSRVQSTVTDAWYLIFNSGSSAMTNYYKTLGLSIRCLKDPTATSSLPTITTTAISAIAQTTATSGGNVMADGGATATARGACWSTTANPSITDSHTTDGSGTGAFVSNLTGLSANTLYHVRAYATNSVGTAYGIDLSFTTLASSINIPTVSIPAGTFTMGSPISEVNRYGDETQHSVTLSAFQMSKYEITNAQFAAFLNAKSIGSNGIYAAGTYPTQVLIYTSAGSSWDWGLHYTGGQWAPAAGYDNYPCINVTWYGAVEFCTYAGGRLPTESEWEYACRATTSTPFHTGNCLSNLQANYSWNRPYNTCTNTSSSSPSATQAVGTYAANAYGLFDMHGNVQEWCSDWYATYPSSPQTNPTGPATGSERVYRGGSCIGEAQTCRSAFRYPVYPNTHDITIGFRMVLP